MSASEHVFPPKLVGRYDVVDGRVQTRSLEAHVVDHCNLKCAECCSLSPLLPPWFADPKDLAADLDAAAAVLAPGLFKIVGGEPTLHPELVELVRVARRSKIARAVSVTTNGLLLDRLPDALWQAVDALTISLYPAPALSSSSTEVIEAKARQFDVKLNWKKQDEFVRMNRQDAGGKGICVDDDENQRVYDACWLRERCHILRDGRFFTCTRPPHFHSWFQSRGAESEFNDDGLALKGSSVDDVVAYLKRPHPLKACAHCHGGSAPMGPHRQMTRDEVRAQTSSLKILP
ncbi:MAG: radical SAM protein [Deltaproteobacteria bacterium]|nr:radical SAM protein [Deltaproteobacteria bacterium]